MSAAAIVANQVEIVAFKPEHQQAFKDLNEEWISKYFKMEEADYKALDHAQEYIIDKGGHILIALLDGEPVGTSAMVRMDDRSYELAKMSVSPKAHGQGIGKLLMESVIAKARTLGANRLYIESNTCLVPAISLYRRFGFVEITGNESPYERCNIQLELFLD